MFLFTTKLKILMVFYIIITRKAIKNYVVVCNRHTTDSNSPTVPKR